MAKSSGASTDRPEPTAAQWAEREAAAYRSAEQEIELLRPGEAILYRGRHREGPDDRWSCGSIS